METKCNDKKMFILISHPVTPAQEREAKEKWGVTQFIVIADERWSQIPPEDENLTPLLLPYCRRIEAACRPGDLLFVQGDFGATCAMVDWAMGKGLVPLYATTRRRAVEKVEGDRVTTTRVFEHVRFRTYERITP